MSDRGARRGARVSDRGARRVADKGGRWVVFVRLRRWRPRGRDHQCQYDRCRSGVFENVGAGGSSTTTVGVLTTVAKTPPPRRFVAIVGGVGFAQEKRTYDALFVLIDLTAKTAS